MPVGDPRNATHTASAMIGVDFDNTIVTYDALMHRIALEWELIDESVGPGKRAIRDAIRASPHGELAWQRLQIAAYGTRIQEAPPAEGVQAFFARCREAQIPVFIVSHKTIYPNLGEPRVNLRNAALGWLEEHGFISPAPAGTARADVYFEATRPEKIARIKSLGLTHFIDDLEETFAEPGFPPGVVRILYSADASDAPGITRIGSWKGIADHFWPHAAPAPIEASRL